MTSAWRRSFTYFASQASILWLVVLMPAFALARMARSALRFFAVFAFGSASVTSCAACLNLARSASGGSTHVL